MARCQEIERLLVIKDKMTKEQEVRKNEEKKVKKARENLQKIDYKYEIKFGANCKYYANTQVETAV